MIAVRLVCKKCGSDMMDVYYEDVGYLLRYYEYRCPECGTTIGVELDESIDERAVAELVGDYY